MNTEHGKQDLKTFLKGANSDKEKELLGAKDTGEYIKSRNARNYSVDGNTDGLEKIKGEEVLYPNANLGPDYVCIGTARINDDIIEFWCSPNVGELDSIRVNGTVMASSDGLLFEVDRNLQLDTNDECKGGEVFITDNYTVPMIFNIQDLKDNVGTPKYFADFNRKLYEINLSAPVDKPVFTRLVPVGGGGGLPVGQYSYAIRYVNEAGDRTNLSPSTPLIPVTQTNGTSSAEYPGTKTRGSAADLSVVSSFGIELKFRITNEFEYDSIEVIRYAWNAGTQLGFSPTPEIVGRVNVSGTKIGVYTFTDPVSSNIQETLPEDELTNQQLFIERAKAIRYFDKRLVLMNYSIEDRIFEPDLIERNNIKGFPIAEAMGKQGHKDAYNHTYRKSYTSGEKYGFALVAWDGVSAKSFAVPIDEFGNYQFPSRRDPIAPGSDSEIYSTGTVTASDTEGNVSETFEVFDLEDTKQKTENCRFKNILDGTNALGVPEGTKSDNDVNQDCTEDPELYGANVTLGRVAAPYGVYGPKGQNDPDTSDHNYQVNTYVQDQGNDVPYNPDMFGLNYFSKGLALHGIDKSTIPDWVKSIGVVRTERANRVVCQGLLMYKINPADPNLVGNSALASKDREKFWFYSPDLEEGAVGESISQDMRDNPNNYKLQFVSPLGFASELYSFDQQPVSGRDRQCDLMTYARVLKDGPLVAKNINPGEALNMGNLGYTAYNRFRNTSDAVNGDFFDNANGGGNRLAQMTSFENVTIGRGSFWELGTQELIYNRSQTGGDNEFSDPGMRNWHEPFYIVNIIQEGANITEQNIESYKDTGAYVKMESVIGDFETGLTSPSFELVDERWEDCIPALSSTDPTAGEERYVFIRNSAGDDETWFNVTYKTPAEITTIVNDITTNGFHTLPSGTNVTGVYTHTVNSITNITINFDVPGFDSVLFDDKIAIVKYDSNAPIKVFGGDTTVGETIFSPLDMPVDIENWDIWISTPKEYNLGLGQYLAGKIREYQKGFPLNVGFPFREYHVTPRHYILKDPLSPTDKIQASRNVAGDRVYGRLYYIRQMCVMFTVESRIATHFAYNENYPNEFFPNTHYVMRPNTFSTNEFANGATAVYEDNSISPQYEEDYGDEYLNWYYGGFRFKQNFNIDYSQQNIDDFVKKPDFGFEEETDFCTGVVWSLSRAENQQDSPGLKSFGSLNSVILEDAQGQINMAYDANSTKGSNLYAIMERGVCLLLHKKSILSDATGKEIGLFTGNNFIQGEYWLDRNIGSNDNMWRGAAEGSIGVNRTSATGKEDGEMRRVEGLVFSNDMSVYRLVNNEIKDIGRDAYYSEIRKSVKGVLADQNSRVTAYYDEDYNEFLLQLEYQDPDVTNQVSLIEDTFVYSFNSNAWVSNFDYRFDKYLSIKDKMYGMKDGETYELNKGFLINGQNIQFEVEQASSLAPHEQKEFQKININSNNKPTRVEFKDIENNVLCSLDPANPTQGQYYLKKYDGFTQQIPRKDAANPLDKDRIQDRLLIYKIFHNLGEDFVVKNAVVTFKLIR
jgi:hypothetical protein